MSCQVELIPTTEGNRITLKEDEKVIVGRGSSLGCNDKKISRQHAELVLKKDDTLWIKPMHTNPVFYRPANGKTIQLTKDVEQELKDGDQIGLLPTSFFFRVSFTKDTNYSNGQSTAATSTSPPDEAEAANSDSKSRKLPIWMSSSNGRSSVKRQLSADKDKDSSTNKPPDAPAATVSDKSSKYKNFDSESDDGFDSVAPKKIKSSDKRRPVCPYGATCYRKNPTHRTDESHPGDSDYEDEKETKNNAKKTSTDVDKPLCPYGKTCYRQNPEHKRDYQH